jgi:hypothetical protein
MKTGITAPYRSRGADLRLRLGGAQGSRAGLYKASTDYRRRRSSSARKRARPISSTALPTISRAIISATCCPCVRLSRTKSCFATTRCRSMCFRFWSKRAHASPPRSPRLMPSATTGLPTLHCRPPSSAVARTNSIPREPRYLRPVKPRVRIKEHRHETFPRHFVRLSAASIAGVAAVERTRPCARPAGSRDRNLARDAAAARASRRPGHQPVASAGRHLKRGPLRSVYRSPLQQARPWLSPPRCALTL